MFEKYNAVLRKFTGVPYFEKNWKRLCLGNTYATTIHAVRPSLGCSARSLAAHAGLRAQVNSCILKMSKIQVASPVFRGFTGLSLPDMFWTKNRYNVAGGVEYGFLSTSTDRTQAKRRAPTPAVHTSCPLVRPHLRSHASVDRRRTTRRARRRRFWRCRRA